MHKKGGTADFVGLNGYLTQRGKMNQNSTLIKNGFESVDINMENKPAHQYL